MKSLFFRLFIAFLLAMLISGAVFFSLAFRVKDWLLETRHPEIALQLRQHHHGMFFIGPGPIGPPPGPPPPGLIPRPFFFDLGFQAAIFLVVGGAVCYLLAWRITAPVRRLRVTVQQLADGDLSARTGISAGARGDEVTDLGRDFDRMAERIEALMTAQQQLVRDVSHELRSPLARLQVALELARRNAPVAAEPALGRIEQEALRLNEMIGELLTLSLLENGSTLPSQEIVNLKEVLAEVVQDTDFEAAGTGRQVRFSGTDQVMIMGNRELLRRALENVVRNAVRYTGPDSVVMVELQQHAPAEVCILVRDHGPGVPDNALEAIFQPFYRVAEARDRQSGGTGIGLAITSRTIRLHGGSVTARNHPEGGLEVELCLPVHAQPSTT